MRVAVTGGTGFIGAHAVAKLSQDGHRPVLLVRNEALIESNLGPLGVSREDIDVVKGDMTDPQAVKQLVTDADAVIHVAAVVLPLDRAGASKTIDINVNGAKNVLGQATNAGCKRIIHVSSVAAILDWDKPIISADLPPALESPNPYTKSKALSEQFARELQAEGHPVSIVYPGGVIGPPAGHARGDAAEGFVSMLKSRCVVTKDGAIGIIDARDLATVLTRALEVDAKPNRFIAGGLLTNLPQIAQVLRDLTGHRMPVLPIPGVVFRKAGAVTDRVRRVKEFKTVFTEEAMSLLTLALPTDDAAVNDVLGVAYRAPAEAIEATVRGLYDAGLLSAKDVGKMAR